MPTFLLSRRAEADLMGIAEYTQRTWGKPQTARYLNQMEACCQRLAGNPRLGRACYDIRPGLRRMEQGKHVVFYREQASGILISRILHQSMLPENQPMEEN